MRSHAKASTGGSTMRGAACLGPIVRGAFATRGASCDADGSGALSRELLALGLLTAVALFLLATAAPALAINKIKLEGAGTGSGTVTSTSTSASAVNFDCHVTAGVPDEEPGESCEAEIGTIFDGLMNVTPTPDFGSAFASWVFIGGPGSVGTNCGGGAPTSDPACGFAFGPTATENEATLTVEFGPAPKHPLEIEVLGDGGVEGEGIECDEAGNGGAECEEEFFEGSEVPLGASAGPGAEFVGWTTLEGDGGSCVGTAGSCETGPLAGPTKLRAEFAEAPEAPPVKEIKQVVAYFGGEDGSGSLGGEFNNPRDSAVNATGEGPADEGDIYVADDGNHRIQRFDSEGNFISAWGTDVSLPDGGTDYEICTDASECQSGAASGGNETSAGNGTLDNPQSVAVDGDTGRVYVSDRDNRRVNVYEGDGTFVASYGWDVVDPISPVGDTGAGYEVCDAGAEPTIVCQAGAGSATPGAGQFHTQVVNGGYGIALSPPDGEAVTGTIFLSNSGAERVNTYDLDGAGPAGFGTAGSGEGEFAANYPRAIAVDSRGILYAANSNEGAEVERYDTEGKNGPVGFLDPIKPVSEGGPLLPGAATATAGLAVDPDEDGTGPEGDALYVLRDPSSGPTVVQQIGPVNKPGFAALPTKADEAHGAGAGFGLVLGLGIDIESGNLLVSTANQAVGPLSSAHRAYILAPTLPEPSAEISGVTDVDAHGATVSGFVNPGGSPGGIADGLHTSYRLAFKRSADAEFSQTAAFDVGNGTTNQLVTKSLGSLEAATSYDVRLLASRPFGAGSGESEVFSFSTPAAPAEVSVPEATSGIEDGEVRAGLYGKVSPNSKATTYRFDYGKTIAYGQKAPAAEASAGSGAVSVPVAQFVSGLEPDTTYHFRLVAKSPAGSSESPDRTFTTPPLSEAGECPNEAIREQQGSTHLPDCRAFELVTPAEKGSGAEVNLGSKPQMGAHASRDGQSLLYPIQGGLPDSTAGGYLRQQADRAPTGWQTGQLSAPSLIEPPEGGGYALPSRLTYAPDNLECSISESYNPLTADTPSIAVELGVTNLYRRNADGSWDLLSDRVPQNPEVNPGSGDFYSQVESSEDCSRVYFRSTYELIPGASGLYEWDEGTLRDAGVLPDGSVGEAMDAGRRAVPGGEQNSQGTGRWDAVSPDGSRFFFTAISNEGDDAGTPAVFMRSDGGTEVTNISQSKTAVPTNGARFEAASADGGKVIFRANYGIAAQSSAGPTGEACGSRSGETSFDTELNIEAKPCDLYAYDVGSGDLTDLSADANAADPIGAAIQGAVAIDEDGSHVYFAALGQLVPGEGRTYAQNTAGEGSANVYLTHDGEFAYVTTLDRGPSESLDLFGSGQGEISGAIMRGRNQWSAATSADGAELIFEAAGDVAGYTGGGGKAAYRYSADTGTVGCLSCPLDGEPTLVLPSGKAESRIGDGPKLLTSARGTSETLQGQTERARSISSDGRRIFFTSPDPLAPDALAGKRNVYQWQRGELRFFAVAERGGEFGGYPELGAYVDTSTSGDDVFIATNEQLAPQDNDFAADVYDVRVGGGFPFSEAPPDCQVDDSAPLEPGQERCQGESEEEPDSTSPTSSTLQGQGNVAQEAANPCAPRARRARALSRRAKAMRRRARRASSPRARLRLAKGARRNANRARRNSTAAKRCRRRARVANFDRGGAK